MLEERPDHIHTCAQEAIFVVEGVDTGTVANQGGRLEGFLLVQLRHAQLGLQVDSLPVRCLLDRLVDLPAQLPAHSLPHLRAGVDHLHGNNSLKTLEHKGCHENG